MNTIRYLVSFCLCCFILSASAKTLDDLFVAVTEDKPDLMIETLKKFDINSTDDMGNTPLIVAAFEGSNKCFDELIKRGADVKVKNKVGDTAIMIAALKGNMRMLKALQATGADINPKGWSPLIYAATNGNTEIVDYLIHQGVNIDMTSPNGTTALMMAAKGGHYETVKVLVWNIAELNAKNDSGMTALKYAQQTKNTDIAKLLKKAGAKE